MELQASISTWSSDCCYTKRVNIISCQWLLLAHHHINTSPVDVASDDSGVSMVAAINPSLPQYDHALTIDPLEAQVFDDALTLEPLPSKDSDENCYQLGLSHC